MPYADKRKLRIGLVGLSLDEIQKGRLGLAAFPTGQVDSTAGQREWETFEVEAFEIVREKRDVIVTDNQGRIKEHTPIELSYEKEGGGYERVSEENPLPVKTRIKKKTFYNELSAGVPLNLTPGIDKYVVLHDLYLAQAGTGANARIDILDKDSTWRTIFTSALSVGVSYHASFPELKLDKVTSEGVEYEVKKGDGQTVTVRIITTASTTYVTVIIDEQK